MLGARLLFEKWLFQMFIISLADIALARIASAASWAVRPSVGLRGRFWRESMATPMVFPI
jgi:hypothetical protein